MNETEVLLKIHKFFKSRKLGQDSVVRLFTDSHPTLLPYKELAPFQRFTLDMEDFVMHPDLVGQLSDGATLFAVEAKGDRDLLKGLTQAEMYQNGFHYTFIAADQASLGRSLISFAKRKNVGVIAAGDKVKITHFPEARMPMRDAFQSIARQMDSVIQVSRGKTFHYNIPTHYLVWAIALRSDVTYSLDSVRDELVDYPMPKQWRSALSGAQKLNLVRIRGDEVRLTAVGDAAKDILPASIGEWTQVHRKVGARGGGIPLAQYQPQSAALLRLLLLQDRIVRLVVEALRAFPDKSARFDELALACDQLDHASAPIFFLKPEAASVLSDDKGKIDWKSAKGEHYRSSTFYQYKSILKHAGILKPTTLGGSTAKGYDPSQDMWKLA
jgi:hypothetical protein